jgi:hypothetical protein
MPARKSTRPTDSAPRGARGGHLDSNRIERWQPNPTAAPAASRRMNGSPSRRPRGAAGSVLPIDEWYAPHRW